MASNQHRPRTRLSLRSNTIPYGSMSSEQPDSDASSMPPTSISKKRAYVAVAVLCYVNLLNYMDRYTIAGEHIVIKAISGGIVHRKSLWKETDVVLVLFQVCCLASRITLESLTAHLASYRQVSVWVCSTLHWQSSKKKENIAELDFARVLPCWGWTNRSVTITNPELHKTQVDLDV